MIRLALALAVAAGAAWAGMPAAEDRRFLEQAAALSLVQAEMAPLAGRDENFARLAQRLAADHVLLLQRLQGLAAERAVALPAAPASEAARQLSVLPPEAFGQAFAEKQLDLHDRLVALYRGEATAGRDRELAAFAAETLVAVEDAREAVARLAAQYGIASR